MISPGASPQLKDLGFRLHPVLQQLKVHSDLFAQRTKIDVHDSQRRRPRTYHPVEIRRREHEGRHVFWQVTNGGIPVIQVLGGRQ
jgi:hypothetical protein